ncbi:TetR/AcrR family transcriptional regulator [Gammaproteobacteria bacterium]|nr:TetR/AcrR family transcriptional regulator [Gammaproteobacteria bacterium]
MPQPKQERSKKRIQIILDTAEKILLDEGLESLTIANISKYSGLKRTSTYKFFPTADSLKEALIIKYINDCSEYFEEKSYNINTENLSVVILRYVEILYDYFQESSSAQIIILKNTVNPPIDSSVIRILSTTIQSYIESNIKLPDMHNKDGIYRVLTQVVISIFSLNVKESGLLNETGKIEAHRAGYSYMQNWVNQSS